ncbi:MAG: class I fructose-bisphosphate aldolase [Mycobacterium sp.]|uniref:class I fructose-bisphosphate aldolase n=1 Tax=Mycobacterium sp. TaxID=1785 RepID=UPI003F9D8C3D
MTASAAPVTSVAASDLPRLVAAANALVAGDKGLLAIDESIPTCNKRFARLGIGQTEHNRRAYRELIVTTPGLADSISGVILCDETIRQHTTDGEAFATVLVNAASSRAGRPDAALPAGSNAASAARRRRPAVRCR